MLGGLAAALGEIINDMVSDMVHVLDLNFLHLDHAIAAFLLKTSAGPILIETGPHSTFGELTSALKRHGVEPEAVRTVLLTHVHLDHAGAAWAFAHSGATVHVHPRGVTHLVDPSKLMMSARRIYKEQMDRLWGDMQPIPEAQVNEAVHEGEIRLGDHSLFALHTPGHAKHHVAWQLDDVIFAGDVGGIRISQGPITPPCPPPDIDLEAWRDSLDLILSKRPRALYLTHFGAVTDVERHIDELRSIMDDWAQWVRLRWESGMDIETMTPQFIEYTNGQLTAKGVNEHGLKQYEAANPAWMSVAGLVRYWSKKSAAAS